MARYILKRFAQSLVTVAMVLLAVFMLLQLMPKTGYFTRDDYINMDEAARTAYLRSLGVLDGPLVQFGRFVAGAARGDLGRSITVYPRTPITEIIAQKVPYSLWFGLAGIGVSMSLGLWLGVAMARYKDGLVDGLGTAYVVLVRAVPSLIYLFFIQIGVSALLGLPMVFYEDRPESWILPGVSMSLSGLAWYAIWLRRFMVDEEIILNSQSLRACRAARSWALTCCATPSCPSCNTSRPPSSSPWPAPSSSKASTPYPAWAGSWSTPSGSRITPSCRRWCSYIRPWASSACS